ncbi:MAG TPA: DegT/DnrJ/EryC1/StrS family aminotransferase [Bdellovibrionota bacterium]|nr:DegT/DnrJ/EryC1/StrS family aminotransferase [Bdellovibrionota bacterium]
MSHGNVPILDLGPDIQRNLGEYVKAFEDVLKSGQFILGPSVEGFEKDAAAYLGTKHAIGLNSGTDALVIGLRCLGVGPGDEVITTPFTFFATAEAISLLGAKPVFVDIDPRTFNIDAAQVEKKITAKTKVILPVHLYGQSADMEPILALARKRGLKVLEDTAQAWGAEYQGKKAGTMGDVGAYSFFPSKNLGAFGDGGLLSTNDDKVAELARKLRAHGGKNKYFNEMLGYNSRLDAVQAALLRVKMRTIDAYNDLRREAARRYGEILSRVPGLETPAEASGCKHVYHQYTVRLTSADRQAVQDKLTQAGIQTMIYYPMPLHRMPMYGLAEGSMPEAEKASQQVLSLPMGPDLPAEVQARVGEALRNALRA